MDASTRMQQRKANDISLRVQPTLLACGGSVVIEYSPSEILNDGQITEWFENEDSTGKKMQHRVLGVTGKDLLRALHEAPEGMAAWLDPATIGEGNIQEGMKHDRFKSLREGLVRTLAESSVSLCELLHDVTPRLGSSLGLVIFEFACLWKRLFRYFVLLLYSFFSGLNCGVFCDGAHSHYCCLNCRLSLRKIWFLGRKYNTM